MSKDVVKMIGFCVTTVGFIIVAAVNPTLVIGIFCIIAGAFAMYAAGEKG
jgi:uncharacterized membrane protein HdeD (DUF308 family)